MSLIHNADGLSVYNADLLDALPELAPGSIDAVVTSPPYAMQRASTYGGVPEKDYPDWTVAWMNALKPALKDTGSVIINIRPHIKNGQISDYVLRTRLALRDAGWCELEELIWFKRSSPPTGSPSRPRRSWESLHWFGKHGRAYGNPKANGQTAIPRTGKANPWMVGHVEDREGWDHGLRGGMSFAEGQQARCMNVAEVNLGRKTEFERANAHPATYPWQLAEWCAKLICPPGGTVLDPFAGSGSTAVAALRNGFQSVAIEREPEYAQMIVDRYQNELAQRTTLQAGRDKGFRSIGIEADADYVALIRERLEQGSGEPDLFTFGSGG